MGQPGSKKPLLGHQWQFCTAALDSEGHFDLCFPNRGQLGLEVAPALVAFFVFRGGAGHVQANQITQVWKKKHW